MSPAAAQVLPGASVRHLAPGGAQAAIQAGQHLRGGCRAMRFCPPGPFACLTECPSVSTRPGDGWKDPLVGMLLQKRLRSNQEVVS